MTDINIVNCISDSEWRRFVAENPHGNIFHTPEMFQVFAQAKGHHSALWAAVDDKQHLIALLLPVAVTLISGLMRPLTTRSVVYGSVLLNPDETGKSALKLLL